MHIEAATSPSVDGFEVEQPFGCQRLMMQGDEVVPRRRGGCDAEVGGQDPGRDLQ